MDSNNRQSRTSLQADFQQQLMFHNQQEYITNLQQNMEILKMTQNMCEQLAIKLQQIQQQNALLKTTNIELQQKITDLNQQISHLKKILLKEKDQQYQIQIRTYNTIMQDKILDLTKRNQEVEKKVHTLTHQLQKSQYKIIKLTRQKHQKIEKNLHNYFQFGKVSPTRQRPSHNVSQNAKFSHIQDRSPMEYNDWIEKQKQRQKQMQIFRGLQKQSEKEKERKRQIKIKIEKERQKYKQQQLNKQIRALKWKLAQKQQEIMYMIRRNKMLEEKCSHSISSHPNSFPNTSSNRKTQKYQKQGQQKQKPQIQKQKSKRNFKKLIDEDRFYTCQTEPNKLTHF